MAATSPKVSNDAMKTTKPIIKELSDFSSTWAVPSLVKFFRLFMFII